MWPMCNQMKRIVDCIVENEDLRELFGVRMVQNEVKKSLRWTKKERSWCRKQHCERIAALPTFVLAVPVIVDVAVAIYLAVDIQKQRKLKSQTKSWIEDDIIRKKNVSTNSSWNKTKVAFKNSLQFCIKLICLPGNMSFESIFRSANVFCEGSCEVSLATYCLTRIIRPYHNHVLNRVALS